MSEDYIFKFDNPDWKIKGILSATGDNEAMDREMKSPFPTPKSYIAEIIAIIWTDEKMIWNWKMRIKFPSGNKQVVSGTCAANANETKCLHEIYKFPMIDKYWFPNPSGDIKGLIEIMKKNNLIDYMEVRHV